MFIFCDGCDAYAATGDLTKRWASAGSTWAFGGSTSGRYGAGSISAVAASGTALVSPTWPATTSLTQMVGFWLKAPTVPSATQLLVELDGASGASGLLYIDNAGHLFGRIGSPTGTALIPTTLINVCDGNWHWIEASFTASSNFALFVDATNCGTISGGGATVALTHAQIWSNASTALNIDDVIIWDAGLTNTVTGTPNQGFTAFPISPRQISTIRPTSDSAVQFATVVGGGGTHFSTLNETTPDGDTSYCQDPTAGHQDTFGFAALSYTPAVINSVILNAYLKVGNPGTINNTLVGISGGTTASSATQATPSAYTLRQVNFDSDPNTTAAWAAAALNAATFGYKNS